MSRTIFKYRERLLANGHCVRYCVGNLNHVLKLIGEHADQTPENVVLQAALSKFGARIRPNGKDIDNKEIEEAMINFKDGLWN